MKHVVVLNQFALPRTQSGGTRHIDLFSRLEGWTPLIIAGNRNHYTQQVFEVRDQRFRLVRVPGQQGGGVARILGWLAYSFQAFFLTVSRRRLDLVYGSSPHLLAPLAGLAAARLRRVPFVLEIRDLWPESIVAAGKLTRGSPVFRAMSALEKLLVTSADRIVVVTPGWDEHFAELGTPAAGLTVITNGTEPGDFVVAQTRDELRLAHGISGFTAVFAGAHGPKDGLELILDAAAALPEINFILVGAGPAKEQARARARRENLANVDFREPVAKRDLAGLLRACDVGIHAVSPLAVFDKGMSPNKLFDYMASGLPVVSNAERGLREVIVDGDCGHVGGSGALGSCLREVYGATPEQRTKWGARGREIVTQRFSRQAAAQELREVLGS